MTPLPVLVEEPLMYFSNSDADSGDNGDVRYIVSAVTAEYVLWVSLLFVLKCIGISTQHIPYSA